MNHLWSSIHEWDFPKACQYFFVLCNVEVDSGIEKNLGDNLVLGIFYKNAAPHSITKDLYSILKEYLWYSKKVLRKCLLGPRSSDNFSIHRSSSKLIFIEKELLSYIPSAYTEKDISNYFNIITHAAKTHIYNINRKINATNRFQATLGYAKFL